MLAAAWHQLMASELAPAFATASTLLGVTCSATSHRPHAACRVSTWSASVPTRRAAAGVQAGDLLDVELALDTATRDVEVPDDLAAALAAEPAAKAFWDGLSYSNKSWHTLQVVPGAKKPETRAARVGQDGRRDARATRPVARLDDAPVGVRGTGGGLCQGLGLVEAGSGLLQLARSRPRSTDASSRPRSAAAAVSASSSWSAPAGCRSPPAASVHRRRDVRLDLFDAGHAAAPSLMIASTPTPMQVSSTGVRQAMAPTRGVRSTFAGAAAVHEADRQPAQPERQHRHAAARRAARTCGSEPDGATR